MGLYFLDLVEISHTWGDAGFWWFSGVSMHVFVPMFYKYVHTIRPEVWVKVLVHYIKI